MRSVLRALRSTWYSIVFDIVCRLRGPGVVLSNFDGWARKIGPVAVLRRLGASIGDRVNIEPGFRVQNPAGGRCGNLVVGSDVYIGPEVLVDLACRITIESMVTIAGRVGLVTHFEVGSGELRRSFARTEGPVTIHQGSFVGFGSVLLKGVTVGPESVIGAGSVVLQPVPGRVVAAGNPCTIIRAVAP